MRRAPLLLLLCAGCDQLWEVREFPHPDAMDCVHGDPVDDFISPVPCGSWGMISGNTYPTNIVNKELVIDVNGMPGGANYSGCIGRAGVDFADAGIFIEVTKILNTGGGFTVVHAYGIDNSTQAAILASIGDVHMIDTNNNPVGSPTNDPSMKWWRLRPSNSRLVGEVSPDGQVWTLLGSVPDAPGMVKLDFGAGANDKTTMGSARFAKLNVCP